MPRYKYMEDAERSEIEIILALRAAKEPTKLEKEKSEMIELYFTHRELCSLGTFYDLYPDQRPKGYGNER